MICAALGALYSSRLILFLVLRILFLTIHLPVCTVLGTWEKVQFIPEFFRRTGSINIDAEEIKKHKLVQEETEMVELHNGCICCTLRGDLLKTVRELSESDEAYDYLVIESTGIAEPLPVAQGGLDSIHTPI